MNGYQVLLGFVGFAVLVLLALGAAWLVLAARRRRDRAWVTAKENAQWKAVTVVDGSGTQVLIQQVARLGHRKQVLNQQFVGKVSVGAADHTRKLDELWAEAIGRSTLMNSGPLM